jgi:4-diphosphocytidyl-2-C-methyl-D-erythritol kinase
MRGIGELLGPPLKLPQLFAVLVNPGVALSTAEVFGALGLEAGDAPNSHVHPPIDLEASNFIERLAGTRNDLESPARKLAPAIGHALALLGATPGCRLARMSGSGATVFGLFDDCSAGATAAKLVHRARPDWWVKATVLR